MPTGGPNPAWKHHLRGNTETVLHRGVVCDTLRTLDGFELRLQYIYHAMSLIRIEEYCLRAQGDQQEEWRAWDLPRVAKYRTRLKFLSSPRPGVNISTLHFVILINC